MVLPAPPAHAPPVEPHWFNKVVVAIELSAHGVLTLVDHAAPSRLREAYLRLLAHDPAAELIVDVQRLAELAAGKTVMMAITPTMGADALDWLNLNRPLIADRRFNLVLWCEGDAAAVLARGAPDFFDWISARVDCPPAPAAFAVAGVKAAIRTRAPGIAWAGPGLEETLAAVRPGRPIRRVAVASYQSMIDALTAHAPGWLLLDGIDTDFHLRRLRWAMAETGRRVIVVIVFPRVREMDLALPKWRALNAEHVPITDAVHEVMRAGGTAGLAALTGLDPAAMAPAIFLLRKGVDGARLAALLSASPDPRVTLLGVARPMGWGAVDDVFESHAWDYDAIVRGGRLSSFMIQGIRAGEIRRASEDVSIVRALHARPPSQERWAESGTAALGAGDFEVAIRWLTAALPSLPEDPQLSRRASILAQRGRAHRLAGLLVSARTDLEQAHAGAAAADPTLAARTAAWLCETLVLLGERRHARAYLEPALLAIAELGDQDAPGVVEALAGALLDEGELAEVQTYLQRVLANRQGTLGMEDHESLAGLLGALGRILAIRGDMAGAHGYLRRSLEMTTLRFGHGHPAVATASTALARVDRAMGDLRGAEELLHGAYVFQSNALGSGHSDIADTLVVLAQVLAASGDLQEAESSLEDALEIQQKAFGDDGQLAGATTRRELAKILTATGDLTSAIENLQQALATLRRIHEREDHPDVVSTLRELERLQALQFDVQRPD